MPDDERRHAEVVLELQLQRMTTRRREDLAREVAELRQELGRG